MMKKDETERKIVITNNIDIKINKEFVEVVRMILGEVYGERGKKKKK